MTAIKPYEPMWFIFTYGDEPKLYHMPMQDIERIMDIIAKPNPPKYLDLRKYWYGRESTSMIRWAKEYSQVEWEIQWFVLQQDDETRYLIEWFIKNRRHENMKINLETIKQFLARHKWGNEYIMQEFLKDQA